MAATGGPALFAGRRPQARVNDVWRVLVKPHQSPMPFDPVAIRGAVIHSDPSTTRSLVKLLISHARTLYQIKIHHKLLDRRRLIAIELLAYPS